MSTRTFAALALAGCLSSATALGAEQAAASAGESVAQATEPATPAPPIPDTPVPVAPAPAPPAGQWVYTTQYGWVWLPYAQNYTYVNPAADTAYMYVYYPAYGWSWVASPWVLGIGPVPYWGVHGRVGFVWYSHPWFHAYGYYHHGVYAPGYHAYRPGYHGGYHGGGHGHR